MNAKICVFQAQNTKMQQKKYEKRKSSDISELLGVWDSKSVSHHTLKCIFKKIFFN